MFGQPACEGLVTAQNRPFRFTTSMPRLQQPLSAWRDRVRKIEDLGFHTVAIADHVGDGWSMDPVTMMTIAAEATTTLRVSTSVLCNDFYHPFFLHRSISNLDVISQGRVTIGLGAGWRPLDYSVSGVRFDPAPVRVARLAESVAVLKGLFAGERFTFEGEHFSIEEALGAPRPVQLPHPPIMIGGGGRRMLQLAGRAADIVGINPPRLSDRMTPEGMAREISAEGLRDKADVALAAASAAGRDPNSLLLQANLLDLRVRDEGGGGESRSTSNLVDWLPDGALDKSPLVIDGDVERCIDALLELRETVGITEVHLGRDPDGVAEIVKRLS
ncbi:TIGR03621 family F420-dependent LLM class oxidoreductase [Dactylosporangium sp. NPDC000555]|uniref:TIGR03621 family F420-dependent LLM class oxidoreductase n=1 Tax=Dactylosporangium sp. NPDC000555 TaxID=3154260 RepID=UPI00331FB3C0